MGYNNYCCCCYHHFDVFPHPFPSFLLQKCSTHLLKCQNKLCLKRTTFFCNFIILWKFSEKNLPVIFSSKMDLYFLRHDEWRQRYNCSWIDIDSVPLEKRTAHNAAAWATIVLCAIYYVSELGGGIHKWNVWLVCAQMCFFFLCKCDAILVHKSFLIVIRIFFNFSFPFVSKYNFLRIKTHFSFLSILFFETIPSTVSMPACKFIFY